MERTKSKPGSSEPGLPRQLSGSASFPQVITTPGPPSPSGPSACRALTKDRSGLTVDSRYSTTSRTSLEPWLS